MDIYKLPMFKEMQRDYKREFGIDILEYIKFKEVEVDFKGFESKYLTKKQFEVIRS
ncbi:Putative terminase-like family protein, partial (plasmid) [Borrelia coriaceae ATCC 43381]